MALNINPDSFGFLVADIARLMNAEMDRRTAEAGIAITSGERRTLAHAARAGAVRQNVLAERMGLEAMTLSGHLDRLEASGLVTRMPDPTDRRAKLVHLTPAGEGMLKDMRPIVDSVHADASGAIETSDWTVLLRQLVLVREALTAIRTQAGRTDKGAAA